MIEVCICYNTLQMVNGLYSFITFLAPSPHPNELYNGLYKNDTLYRAVAVR